MEVVLDTSIVIQFLRGADPESEVFGALLRGHDVYLTTITIFELEVGLGRSTKQKAVTDILIDTLKILDLDLVAAQQAGAEERRLRADGQPIGTADVLIAGICLATRKSLLTSNAKHFSRIPDLIVYTPETIPL